MIGYLSRAVGEFYALTNKHQLFRFDNPSEIIESLVSLSKQHGRILYEDVVKSLELILLEHSALEWYQLGQA